MGKPSFNKLALAPAAVEVTPLPAGGYLLRSPQALAPYARCIGEYLEHWGSTTPQRLFLAERTADGAWRELTYGEALARVRSVGQALLRRGLSVERPVMVLSDNSIGQALLALGAMHVGVPIVPVSPSYSLASSDYVKLKHTIALIEPGLIFVQDGSKFERALRAVSIGDAELVMAANAPSGMTTTPFDALTQTTATRGVDEAFHRVRPDTIAKILFTSGSTDLPKGVINTQRMLCANQQALAQIWPFLAEKPPVIVDWLPWSHTFGGNHNFNIVLRNGGSLYIDEGKPAPGLVERTVSNLRDVAPTLYFNVPRGYDMLLPYLENDEALRANFFRRLDLIFYAAAALPQNLWERLEDVAVLARGERVRMVSSWGSTETAPLVTSVHFEMERAGVIGLPVPGVEVKMVPNDGKFELRVRGCSVTPGYFKRPDLTQVAFDEDGFYRIGDAGRFANPMSPVQGLEFDGRVAEDFKLLTGTWVHVNGLRVKAIAAGAPAIADCVVTGHDQEDIGLLVFPNVAGCRGLCPDVAADLPIAALIARPEVRRRIEEALERLAAEGGGSSTRPARALVMEEPPSGDANEITDKGYINQRAVLLRRAALVERLHSPKPDPIVIRPRAI